MPVSIYSRPNRKPVYLVHKVVGGKVYNKTFPMTKEGKKAADALSDKLDICGEMSKSLKNREFYCGNRIRGLTVSRRLYSGKVQWQLRVSMKISRINFTKCFLLKKPEDFDQQWDAAIKYLRESLQLDARDWLNFRKGIAPAYHAYKAEYMVRKSNEETLNEANVS